MKELRKNFQGNGGAALKTFIILLLALVGMSGRAEAVARYGTISTDRIGLDNALTYSTTPLILGNGDTVTGFACLAGGVHLSAGAATFTNVAFPVRDNIYLASGSTLNFSGDLTLSTTAIRAGGDFTLGADNNVLFLEHDTKLPPVMMTLSSSCTVDGLGHTLTLNSATIVNLGTKSLTLRNMVIKGLQNSTQFTGGAAGTLVLRNCIIDVSGNTGATAFSYGLKPGNLNLDIYDDVIVQGGGTMAFGGTGTLTINPYSTLYLDLDTTFSYWSATRTKVSMSDATSTIHVNGGTLKADAGQAPGVGADAGLQLATGRLFFEGKSILDNGTNATMANGIQLGSGEADLAVKVLSGARVQINGCVWHNPSLT